MAQNNIALLLQQLALWNRAHPPNQQIDPQAELAVAKQEGLSGRIGDGGHAFGDNQLNNAGGVLTGKFAGQSPQQIQQWADSPQGIDYALAGVAKAAGGETGQRAVSDIVSRFERPANIPKEIANALAAYGAPSGQGAVATQSVAGALAARAPAVTAQAPQTDYQPLLAQALSTATGDNYQQFYATLAQALRQRNQPAPQPASQVSMAAPTQTAQPSTYTASSKAGGFLTGNASYKPGRIDQGHDFQTDPGAAIVAPGSGTVVAVKSDPNGFGPAYPIVHFTSGPYAGKDIYIGHTLAALKPGQSFKAGQTISHTGTAPVGNASVPGWAEIGFSTGQLPTGQRPPF